MREKHRQERTAQRLVRDAAEKGFANARVAERADHQKVRVVFEGQLCQRIMGQRVPSAEMHLGRRYSVRLQISDRGLGTMSAFSRRGIAAESAWVAATEPFQPMTTLRKAGGGELASRIGRRCCKIRSMDVSKI